ncbi:MAG: WhiB family transcriptional regulator [Actinomycetota bacterium]|nr:WhiB family transcriptional regulator [Actinomycetota bacterium]
MDQAWRDQAACRGQHTDLFFPPPGGGADAATAQAVALCRRCPVRSPCLDYALHTAAVGIWAGTTDEDRRRLRRRQ